ncbi:MAG: winged helix-turn-helix transcriptional regulator [Candidatus Bathyarchaeia archaeon]|nr:winged helix-turn-helix transcriptional regulator [Candidatus Bathyarchaeota archaeon]
MPQYEYESEYSDEIEVIVRKGDLHIEFRGSTDSVIRSLLKFISEIHPTWFLASKLALKLDLVEVFEKASGVIAVGPEGPMIVVDRGKLTDVELIWLSLAKAWIAYHIGLTEDYTVTSRDIQRETGIKPGTISARLSELSSQGYLDKPRRGVYKLTSLGVKRLIEDIIPEIKGKIGVE